MIVFSLILIVNNKELYRNFLENFQVQENIKYYEIIYIDNCKNKYSSARKAYDEAAMKAKGKYIIFLHPDIRFNNTYEMNNIERHLENINDFGVVGVAGCPQHLVNGDRIILSNIVHGCDKRPAGRYIEKPREVQTVDECFFIVKRDEYKKVRFMQRDGWHLHAVELCLQFTILNKKNFVIPADIWHMSDGKSLDYQYVIQMRQLIKEYGSVVDTINTTVKRWGVRGWYNRLYISYYLIKQWTKGKIKIVMEENCG